jgi:LysM repeat protein
LKLNSSAAAKAILITVVALLFLAGVLPLLANTPVRIKNLGLIQASGTSDPIATGIWQQDQYDSAILQESQNQGLNPFIIKGQIMVESDFNTYALSNVINTACDNTHDEGLMQVNPVCMATGSANLFDPWTNLYYGTNALAFAYSRLGDMSLAIQAYNIGVTQVENGERNWAYYNEVMGYAQQFENEHCQNYGCGSSSTSTTTAITSSNPSCQRIKGLGSTYTVVAGDTLDCVAQKTGVSAHTLASLNNIPPPYALHVGQILWLTSRPAQTTSTESTRTSSSSSSQAPSIGQATGRFSRLQASNLYRENSAGDSSGFGRLSFSSQLTVWGSVLVVILLAAGNFLMIVQRKIKEEPNSGDKLGFIELKLKIRSMAAKISGKAKSVLDKIR